MLIFCLQGWEAADLGNCPKSESSRKWLGEGAKGLLDPASKRPLALVFAAASDGSCRKSETLSETDFGIVILAAPQLPRNPGEFQSHSKVTKN